MRENVQIVLAAAIFWLVMLAIHVVTKRREIRRIKLRVELLRRVNDWDGRTERPEVTAEWEAAKRHGATRQT